MNAERYLSNKDYVFIANVRITLLFIQQNTMR